MKELDARQSFAGKRVVITGGMGFIGSNLARRMLDLDANICVIDSNNPETGANEFNLADIRDRMDIVIADIRDHETIRSLIPGADYLFNLAGLSSHVGGMHAPLEDLEVNALAQV